MSVRGGTEGGAGVVRAGGVPRPAKPARQWVVRVCMAVARVDHAGAAHASRWVDLVSCVMDASSIILEAPEKDLNARIAKRVRELRSSRRVSLEALAGKSGVSRS